jgi:hypothetical protein
MLQLDKCTKSEEIVHWLEDTTRDAIVAVCVHINNHSAYRVPTSGTKDQLLSGLENVKTSVLRAAVDAIFPDEEGGAENNDDDIHEIEEDDDEEDDGQD